jgi:hydroxymethylglutaryl-CoA synthase
MLVQNSDSGVSAMSLYVPPFRVPLESWCEWTGNSWEKISAVVGHSFRVPGRHENVYTMAANAVLRLIRQNGVDPTRVGFLGLGTESSTDNAAGAVIVRGMVDRALDSLGLPRLSRYLEVPEFKHACLGGVYALKSALRYARCDAGDRLAIVVSADVAEYERGSTGEQTQGAGAVAMLVEPAPRLFSVDLAHSGSASDYRGPDFRKPFARHFSEEYAKNTRRVADFPVFSGKYSTFSYLDETVHAVSFLYVRGLARGDHHHDELRALCKEANVAFEEVQRETESAPDLYAHMLEGGVLTDPYTATSAVAGVLRKHTSFRELLAKKMSLGSELVKDLGNLYSAALPAWMAAGLEQAAHRNVELLGSSLVAVGYGSGDAAESLPIAVTPGWRQAALRIGFEKSLAGAVDLSREQYEALHDGEEVRGLAYEPRDEFRISRVGKSYETGFQDLGVEYYEYVAG